MFKKLKPKKTTATKAKVEKLDIKELKNVVGGASINYENSKSNTGN